MRIEKKSTKVKASTNYDEAVTYIRAAIDCLGKQSKTDVVAKDNIANLSTVMFDLLGSKKEN